MTAFPQRQRIDPTPPVRFHQTALVMAVITTSFCEDSLFRLFLRRGFAVNRPRYYSIVEQKFEWRETSMRFLCYDHLKDMCAPKTPEQTRNLGSIPEFTVYFVGNQLIMLDHFVGRELLWLEARKESPEIAFVVHSWLLNWTAEKMFTARYDDGTFKVQPNEFHLENPMFDITYPIQPLVKSLKDIAVHAGALKARNLQRVDRFLIQKREMLTHIEEAMHFVP